MQILDVCLEFKVPDPGAPQQCKIYGYSKPEHRQEDLHPNPVSLVLGTTDLDDGDQEARREYKSHEHSKASGEARSGVHVFKY